MSDINTPLEVNRSLGSARRTHSLLYHDVGSCDFLSGHT